jgi:hypothetical protein
MSIIDGTVIRCICQVAKVLQVSQRITEELTLFEESYQLSAVSHQPKTKAEG